MKIALMTLNSKFIHSSLALRYLQSATADCFPDVSVLEFQINDDQRTILAELGRLRPDVLGCSCYIWNVEQTLALLRDLKQVLPQLTVVLGGPEVGPRAKQLLAGEPAVDFVIVGEGEVAWRQLLRGLDGEPTPPISGVYGRTELAGNCHPGHPLSVEQVPLAYREGELAKLAHKLVYVETSRGCPFGCSYCLSARDKLRHFPLERVFQELDVLLQADIPLIKFVDRTFNADAKRALEIMRYLLSHRQHSHFHFEICVDLLTDELLDFLATVPSGVFQFEIGIQSTSPKTLRAIGRHVLWDRLTGNVRRLQQSQNIHLHLDLIAGLPDQTWSGMAESFDQVMALRPDMLQLGFLKVLPGTPIAEQVQAFGYAVSRRPPYEILQTNWLSFAELNEMHVIEQLLESYYNSGLLKESLPYLWSASAASPWAMFEQLAKHWQAGQLHLTNHSQEKLLELFAAWASPDQVLGDLLTIDRARCLPSYQTNWRLPNQWRTAWDAYLNEHLSEFAPRTYKQALRTVFPVQLHPATLNYYRQPEGMVAVVDQATKRLHGFTEIADEQ